MKNTTKAQFLNSLLKHNKIALNSEMEKILKDSKITEIDPKIGSVMITQEYYRIPGQEKPDSILQKKTGEKMLNKKKLISVMEEILQSNKNDVFLFHCVIGLLKTKYTIILKKNNVISCFAFPFNTERIGEDHGTMIYIK